MVSFSVITPTWGREGFVEFKNHLFDKLKPTDQWICISDGADVGHMLTGPKPFDFYYKHTALTGFWGNHQRDTGLIAARGTHIIFLDDDDALADLEKVREAVALQPNVVHAFEILLDGQTQYCLDNADSPTGQCCVYPNILHKMPRWEIEKFTGPYIKAAAENFGGLVIHRDIPIAHMRVFSKLGNVRPGV